MLVTSVGIEVCADHMNKKPDLINKTQNNYIRKNFPRIIQMTVRHNSLILRCRSFLPSTSLFCIKEKDQICALHINEDHIRWRQVPLWAQWDVWMCNPWWMGRLLIGQNDDRNCQDWFPSSLRQSLMSQSYEEPRPGKTFIYFKSSKQIGRRSLPNRPAVISRQIKFRWSDCDINKHFIRVNLKRAFFSNFMPQLNEQEVFPLVRSTQHSPNMVTSSNSSNQNPGFPPK